MDTRRKTVTAYRWQNRLRQFAVNGFFTVTQKTTFEFCKFKQIYTFQTKKLKYCCTQRKYKNILLYKICCLSLFQTFPFTGYVFSISVILWSASLKLYIRYRHFHLLFSFRFQFFLTAYLSKIKCKYSNVVNNLRPRNFN